ncbi:LysR substrate-binding domain-containing protein [Streptomyces sp. Inha503]|uniref:LysR substrate-binding domain-containing protein n=1 Tax=Streptomyces sp. Inha503 TaxID=3383314 RepID=UPI00399FBC80
MEPSRTRAGSPTPSTAPGYVKGVVFEHVLEEDFCLISSARLPPVANRGDTITLKEASRLGFILPSEVHTVRRITDAAFHAAGLHCSVVAEIEPGMVLRDAGVSGLGVTVLPLTASRAHFAPDEVRAYRFADSQLHTAMSLCTPEVQPLTEAATLVRTCCVRLSGTSPAPPDGASRASRRTAFIHERGPAGCSGSGQDGLAGQPPGGGLLMHRA